MVNRNNADWHGDEMRPWLEGELFRQLAPVPAPPALWSRIAQPRLPVQRAGFPQWAPWTTGAALVVLSLIGLLLFRVTHQGRGTAADPDLLAMAKSSAVANFQSANFDDIRKWVKAAANIDIEVPSEQLADRGGVKLLGARLIHFHGGPVAVIDYQINGESASLFVSDRRAKSGPATRDHLFSGPGNQSWEMRNQSYTIEFASETHSRSACLLCHATTPGLFLLGRP